MGLRKHRQAVVGLQRRSSLPGRGAVRIEGHRRLDAAGEFRIVHWIEAALRAAHRQQRRQMAAGRTTDRANMSGIQLKPVSILPQPADGQFGLLDVGRKCRLARLCELVVDRHADIALRRQRCADVDLAGGGLVAAGPSSAVDDDDAGVFLPGLKHFGQVEIRFFRPLGAQVGDVLLHSHFPRQAGHADRRCQQRGERDRDTRKPENGSDQPDVLVHSGPSTHWKRTRRSKESRHKQTYGNREEHTPDSGISANT